MNGSEKQVAWAMTKITAVATANDRRLADEQARYDADMAEEREGNSARLECRRTIYSIISNGLGNLSLTGDASQIIDLGVDVTGMIETQQAELLPHKAWMEKTFRTMTDFLRWANV
jgi:hypothetical protein